MNDISKEKIKTLSHRLLCIAVVISFCAIYINYCQLQQIKEHLAMGYEDPYINEDWIEANEKLTNWELWDHGNEVIYHEDNGILKMDFWAYGNAIITMINATEPNGYLDDYKIDKNTWDLLSIQGASYYIPIEITDSNWSITVTLYRVRDPYYFYEYKPVTWHFEEKT